MKSHQYQILEKMKGEYYPSLNFNFAFSLTNESDRGAILVGTTKIEQYLEKLLLTIFPEQTKTYKARLLQYPGPLSSFSGKVELLYAFRIIDKKLYLALNTLRKIRNRAAHDDEAFDLLAVWEQIMPIFDFEPNFPYVIENLAYDNLIKFKKHQIKKAFENSEFKDYDYEKIWRESYPDPKADPAIQEQYRIWQLSYGMTFICLKIEAIMDDCLKIDK